MVLVHVGFDSLEGVGEPFQWRHVEVVAAHEQCVEHGVVLGAEVVRRSGVLQLWHTLGMFPSLYYLIPCQIPSLFRRLVSGIPAHKSRHPQFACNRAEGELACELKASRRLKAGARSPFGD